MIHPQDKSYRPSITDYDLDCGKGPELGPQGSLGRRCICRSIGLAAVTKRFQGTMTYQDRSWSLSYVTVQRSSVGSGLSVQLRILSMCLPSLRPRRLSSSCHLLSAMKRSKRLRMGKGLYVQSFEGKIKMGPPSLLLTLPSHVTTPTARQAGNVVFSQMSMPPAKMLYSRRMEEQKLDDNEQSPIATEDLTKRRVRVRVTFQKGSLPDSCGSDAFTKPNSSRTRI